MPTVGQCLDMCPEAEWRQRCTSRSIHPLECDPARGKPQRHLAVKEYTRSEDQPARAVRPPSTLLRTLDHLWRIFEREAQDWESTLQAYHFVSDRARAIRRDLTIQHTYDLEFLTVAVALHEQMVRFHLIASALLSQPAGAASSASSSLIVPFNPFLNTQWLSNCLTTLLQLYDEWRSYQSESRGCNVSCETEMRDYLVLLSLADYLSSSDGDSSCGALGIERLLTIEGSAGVPCVSQLVLRMVSAAQCDTYTTFFRLVDRANLLQASALLPLAQCLRQRAVPTILRAYLKKSSFPLLELGHILGLSGEQQSAEFVGTLGLDTVRDDCGTVQVILGPIGNGSGQATFLPRKLRESVTDLKSPGCLFKVITGPSSLQPAEHPED
eukprot:NODE_1166_length_1665_cov_25.746906_g1034_i0.p1 GENE.NODE_1166_length_1665_cov_25.746906_g1034_i0~~NODE_1166_length_1665_cov_25.746906_g1034_i0.p1  ORF type:complete len:425 (-),score=76.37 NODE_1166_length_1665_cov_25.746906_g1034_i0:389-1537(-)